MTSLNLAHDEFPILQGWWAPTSLDLSDAFLKAEGWALMKVEAFPDPAALGARIREAVENARGRARLGLDLRGLRGRMDEVMAQARAAGASFSLGRLGQGLGSGLPWVAEVNSKEEAHEASAQGASAVLVPSAQVQAVQAAGLPVLASAETSCEAASALAQGAQGVQPRCPKVLRADHLNPFAERLRSGLAGDASLLEGSPDPLPRLKVRNLDLSYPIFQGGMGIGVSWEGLAGAVAAQGCLGLVSAIGTGYHQDSDVPTLAGRPKGSSSLNPPESLARIIREAKRRSGGRGAVGVNILCAIEGYEAAVRASVEAGAQAIVSGAGLPMALPEMVGDADVALIPIVSSPRALAVICKQWTRKYNRLPDAIVLEGPLSGGHQGFTVEQCQDPAFSLENILPGVLAERDKWGSFPVIVAGGVWDHADIRKFLAMGASGVQMATRFIGTFECDADQAFKDVILQAAPEDIVLMPSPVGMPGRGVRTNLQVSISEGTAPDVRCISHCLQPCGAGKSAREVGYCIADRLGDAWKGLKETGLFFSGANGGRVKQLVAVRDLIEEITQDPGLGRLQEA